MPNRSDMATTQPTKAVQHLRRAALLHDGAGLTDGELLACFVEHRDDAAFAALVRRHGPMVWGVCRRLLSHHDAEDAFQAAFLVLVRKAASVRPREMVANWLYGVAHQTALKARATAARRGARERQVTAMPEAAVVEQDLWDDLRPLLDQELTRLPANYRAVIVLCDLEGKTRQEVARQLGLPEGTVGSRLARARAMLAKRLARHGLPLVGGALAAVLSRNVAAAGVPTPVESATIKAASLLAAGEAAAGVIPARVAALAEGVLKMTLLAKLKTVTVLFVAAGIIGLATALLGYRLVAADNASATATQGSKEPSAEKDGGKAKSPKDEEAIQGTWVLVKLEQVNAQPQDPKGTFKVVIAGDKIVFPDKSEATFKLDPTREPKRIEFIVAKGGRAATAPGIYSLRGDELKYCLGREGDTEPPASFDIKKAGPGMFPTCWTLRRDDDGKPPVASDKPPIPEGQVNVPQEQEQEEKDFTAWGKEVGGLQAGLGYRPGEHRVYHHGETATVVLRVRNVGKEAVEFKHIYAFFLENPPTITDADGKMVELPKFRAEGLQAPRSTNVPPGEEAELYEWKVDLQPEGGVNKELFTIHGTGKFSLQCGRVVGPTSGNPNHPNPTLDKLATGKLELEVSDAEKVREKREEGFTAWGKEVGGLQAGLGYLPGQHRTYHTGETVTLVVRVRNVGTEAVKFQYIPKFFVEIPPTVTDGNGQQVHFRYGYIELTEGHSKVDVTLAPGKEIKLGEVMLQTTLLGTGKFAVQYERVFANTWGATITLDPALT
jgi:RNA polymerase sigma factor (sigma-70 family)